MAELDYRLDGAVATLTLNRPTVRNALDGATLIALSSALDQAEREARVIVLTGAGDRVFCAGADLAAVAIDADARAEVVRGYGALLQRMLMVQRPVIARINGHCLAGGVGLMLAADLAVMVEDAQLFLPEAAVGLWPMMVGALLLRDLPRKRALELALTGRRLSAAEAADWGLVNQVVPASGLDAAVGLLAGRVATMGPAALRLGRSAWSDSLSRDPRGALPALADALVTVMLTDDATEGTLAFFQKRPPEWNDR